MNEDPLAPLAPPKHAFAREVSRRLRAIPGVRSVTFTGSFVDRPDLSGISDIDTIVLVEDLTPAVFQACTAALADLSCDALGLPDHTVRLNTTFGPLKFDAPGSVVVHLMIYSVAGHRGHVLQSPFTCLDWERSPCHLGPSLRQTYPVLALQPRQFLEARRGLGDYLDDLAAGAIRYRRYVVGGDTIREIAERQPLDPKHQGEFAYHIVRNFVANYAKLHTRANVRLGTAELLTFWRHALPRSAAFCDWFQDLEQRKHARATSYPPDTLARTREFLGQMSAELEHTWRTRATRHLFVRHARTPLNDGSFLGQGRDPGLAEAPPPLTTAFTHTFSSPARRCRDTALALAPTATLEIDSRLHEIDYGAAEGLTFTQLAERHPAIVAAWKRAEDPCFPEGENTAAVLTRLREFITSLPAQPSLVVTHNVVLRCLLGDGLGLPAVLWHRLPVPHAEPLEVLQLDGRCFLNLTPAQIATISDAVAGHLA